MKIRDENQAIFEWYNTRLLKRYNDDGGWRYLFSYLRHIQAEFNKRASTPCVGLQYMRLGVGGGPCRRLLCPSCWHMRHSAMFTELSRLTRPAYYWRRSTWSVSWDAELACALVKRFKTRSRGLSMLCYTVGLQAHELGPTAGIPFDGQLSYCITGLFRSDTHMTEYGADELGQLYAYDRGVFVGTIEKESLTPQHAGRLWLEQLRHPWEFIAHDELFTDYINHFNPINLGRTTCRLNQTLLKEKT